MEKYICQISEVEENKSIVVVVDDLEVGVLLVKGQIRVFQNYCPHAGGPICLGDVRGANKIELAEDKSFIREYVSETELRLVCPWHGFEYDLDSKKCVTDSKFRIREFEALTKDGGIYINVPKARERMKSSYEQ